MIAPSFLLPYGDISSRQEAFAQTYIHAVVAVAGCSIAVPVPDNNKTDFWVGSRVKGSQRTQPQIHIQSKCLLSAPASKDPISYQLDIDTYDSLRDPLVANPRILVVVLTPNDISNWIMQDEANLVLKHCAYWVSLKDAPEVLDQASRVVHIPRGNVFTPKALQAMMVHTSNGEDLNAITMAEELA